MVRILSGVMVVGDAGIRAPAFTAIGIHFTVAAENVPGIPKSLKG